jgi:hypothetical protein
MNMNKGTSGIPKYSTFAQKICKNSFALASSNAYAIDQINAAKITPSKGVEPGTFSRCKTKKAHIRAMSPARIIGITKGFVSHCIKSALVIIGLNSVECPAGSVVKHGTIS